MGNRSLNEQQQAAVDTLEGPLLIAAGAGTGKTSCLIERLAHMVNSGISPSNILLLTFTNSAAKEMRDRAEALSGNMTGLTACTFHSFCHRVLRKYGAHIGISPDFDVVTPGEDKDAMQYVRAALSDRYAKTKPERYDVMTSKVKQIPDDGGLVDMVSKCMNTETPPTVVMEENGFTDIQISVVNEMIDEYRSFKRSRSLLDYDDLMSAYIELVENVPEVRKRLNGKYLYKMVDEYQDTNAVQLRIVKSLCDGTDNIAVVGDDQQSIYKFRGADFRNIMEFEKMFPGAKRITLERNYRSNDGILNMANAIVGSANEKLEKNLWTDRRSEVRPVVKTFPNSEAEAEWIADEIEKSGYPLSEIAVLMRGGRDSAILEGKLNERGIPYEKRGGVPFFSLDFVRGVFALLQITYNPKNELAWFRTFQLCRNIGPKNSRKIGDAVMENGPSALKDYSRALLRDELNELYDEWAKLSSCGDYMETVEEACSFYFRKRKFVIENSRMNDDTKAKELKALKHDRKVNLPVLLRVARTFDSIYDFVQATSLDAAKQKESEDKLVLSTVHSAKGLEWRFVIGMDATQKHLREDSDIEEERRLFYVETTRAKDRLVYTAPKTAYGRTTDTVMFLRESGEVTDSYDLDDCEYSPYDGYGDGRRKRAWSDTGDY